MNQPHPDDVRAMFAAIAPVYDRLNDVLSLGVHRRWRARTVRMTARPGLRVLDCATGTGDLALAFARAVGPAGRIVGVDFCIPLLTRAREKAGRAGADVSFVVGDALRLPFPDGGFDLATIAFGIRNVADPVACLVEMSRVVRPGGRVAVLELGAPRGPLRGLLTVYARHAMPVAGRLFGGDAAAYRYLPATSLAFPSGADFLALMDEAGTFAARRAHALFPGFAFLYVGEVRGRSR